MRYVHLFLILILVVCYAGICGDTVFAAISSETPEMSCHSQGHDMERDNQATSELIIGNGNEASDNSPCCLDYLHSSSIDYDSNTVFTILKVLPVIDLIAIELQKSAFDIDLIHAGHDPPDLQVRYSTFLL